MTTAALLACLLTSPGAPIHIRVDGEGYFRFARGTQGVYCSDAVIVNRSGLICTPDGLPLLPQIRLNLGASFSVQMDGSVSSAGKLVGRIVLADFPVGALQKSGRYWLANTRSRIGFPGDGVLGIIRNSAGFSSGTLPSPVQKGSAGTTVEVSLKSEIDKPEILLGDVATIQAPQELQDQIAAVDLGATPMFGAQRGITRGYLVAAMRHVGINTDKITLLCPNGAFAVKKGQKVDAESLITAAKDGLKQQLGVTEDVRCDRMIPEFFVPTGQLTYNAIQAIQSGEGYVVNLEVDVDGTMITRRTIGLTPTNPTARILAGEPVKIRVIKNGASVEVDGKTKSPGKVGSTVSVQSDAGANFTGILVTTGLVEVKL
jgi:hypothetical protein